MNDKTPDLAWTPVKRSSIFSTRIFDIQEITSRSPENTESVFFTLHASDWVIVVPVLTNDDGSDSFIMVSQWRHGSEQMSVEFPGGVIDSGEEPEKAAARELVEETGYRAGSLVHLASFSPNPAIMDNRCHVYLAQNLENTKTLDLDDDEYVSADSVPARDVIAKMGHGAYQHGLMSAALFLYIQKKGLSAI